MADDKTDLEQVRRIMGALVRMPPKPHDQMKLGKPRGQAKKRPAKGKQPKR
jgi:hypothetical protein